MAPRRLASTLQSLPPILHIKAQCSVSSYSKGSRGLSVLPRVHCIFTASSISLSLGWRQPGHHYAIRAGRNLPDKEFRYLRTVIVTAAVYWGLSSLLRLRLQIPLTFQHRAGVSPYTSAYALAETCVFVKQLPGPIHCGLAFARHPFSRSYGVNLPSSLTTILPPALGFSPHLPVSVCGTGAKLLHRGFSWQRGIRYFAKKIAPRNTSALTKRICLLSLPKCLNTHSNSVHILSFCVTPFVKRSLAVSEYQPIVHRLRLSAWA